MPSRRAISQLHHHIPAHTCNIVCYLPRQHNLFHNNLTKWVLHSNKPYRCTCQHVSLDLGKFYEAASLFTYNLKCCLEDALPAGVSVYNIAVNNVTDDFSSIAIHKQPDNLAILQPIISQYWARLLAGPSTDKALFNKQGVIHVEVDPVASEIWQLLLLGCCCDDPKLNSGALDPSLFKHNCYDRPNQNIFLLRNGLLSLACPVTSHQETDWHLVLTVMPTDLYQLLLVLMSILLSIATELRSLLLKGQHLPYQLTHL